jgi:uncharacterized protein YlxW (UPF0749 family)
MGNLATIGMELINFNAADYLLLMLVSVFFFSGLGYKIKKTAETSKIRKEVTKTKTSVEELAAKEKSLRDDVNELLNLQNVNMTEINRLKTKKARIGKLPITLGKDLENLVDWCHQQDISINLERRTADKRVKPKGRQL